MTLYIIEVKAKRKGAKWKLGSFWIHTSKRAAERNASSRLWPSDVDVRVSKVKVVR